MLVLSHGEGHEGNFREDMNKIHKGMPKNLCLRFCKNSLWPTLYKREGCKWQ
jgi:hypothetical protein